MDFKYFCWLIIVFLLPKQWSIVGLPTTINYNEEIWDVLAKVSTNMPNDFIRIRDFIFNMKENLDGEINMREGRLTGKNLIIEALKSENKELYTENLELLTELREHRRIVPALQIRDFIDVIYHKMFPQWLKDSEISRYYKWVIAINAVDHTYFGDLRADMRKNNITAEAFAIRVCQIYEKTPAVFIRHICVKRPSEEDVLQFCSSFIADDKLTLFTCKQLVAPVPVLNAVPVRKEDVIRTKFNIIIANITSPERPNLLHRIEDGIKKVPNFLKHKCKIVQSVEIPGNDIESTIHERKFYIHLPGQYYRLGTEINLITGTATEVKNSYNDYTNLTKTVRDEIIKLLPKNDEKSSVFVLDDDMRLPSENFGADGKVTELTKR